MAATCEHALGRVVPLAWSQAADRGRTMLSIRQDQMELLGREMERRFVERTVEHLRLYFATCCCDLGERGTRELVLHGLERAEAHGFTADADVSRYIDVMFAYGRDFDEDPQLPWAKGILEDRSLTDPETRISALCDEAIARQ